MPRSAKAAQDIVNSAESKLSDTSKNLPFGTGR